jgi:hypothetical protein
MPTVNIYFSESKLLDKLNVVAPQLREYLARKLSGSSKKLTPSEISIRFVKVNGGKMMARVELEITAYALPERVKREDKICREVAEFLNKRIPAAKEFQVWLKLCELGHSWQT